MLSSPGLRLSLYGGVVFLIGVVSLLFLPWGIPAAAMFVGGVAVWAGFLQTILHYYTQHDD